MNTPAETTPQAFTGAEAAVEMLKAHGVGILFGLCGDTSLPFYDALARLPQTEPTLAMAGSGERKPWGIIEID